MGVITRRVRERLPALHKVRAQLDAQIVAADRVLEEAEAAHDELTKRRDRLEKQMRQA
jgi:hypothetical protein